MDFALYINGKPKLQFEVVRKRELVGGVCEYRWSAMRLGDQPSTIGLIRHNPHLGIVDLAMKVLQAYQVSG